MRKILFCLAVLLGSIGCNKTKTDVEEIKELTAQFSFVVKDLRLSADSPGYMLQAGDKITMEVKGYDRETYQQMYKMMLPDSPESHVKCSLVYNGSDWDLIRDGQVIQEIEERFLFWKSTKEYLYEDTFVKDDKGRRMVSLHHGSEIIRFDPLLWPKVLRSDLIQAFGLHHVEVHTNNV